MKYKKYSNNTNTIANTSPVAINSLDDIPLPNEIEIDSNAENNNNSTENVITAEISYNSDNCTTTSSDRKTCNVLNKLLKNMNLDDILLFAILILLIQEDSPDELLIGLILVILFNK